MGQQVWPGHVCRGEKWLGREVCGVKGNHNTESLNLELSGKLLLDSLLGKLLLAQCKSSHMY